MQIIVAIDPGKHGGIACEWVSGTGLSARKMPDPIQDVRELLGSFISMAGGMPSDVTAYLEQVSGYAGGKGQPGSAMFTFGCNYGFLQGVLYAMGIRVELVRPQAWQKALGCGTRGDLTKAQWKRKLLGMAQRLYPSVKVTLDTADALLILHYAMSKSQTKE